LTALNTRCSRSGPPLTLSELLDRFEEIWLHDFEFVSKSGEIPDVVCLCARELRTGRTLRLWHDQLLTGTAPYRTDDKVLFVNFVANAECSCHLSMGWPIPKNVLDLSPAFRKITNGRHTPEGKGLIGALRYYYLDTIDAKYKEAMQQRVMQGWPFIPEEKIQILDYCESDNDALQRLLPKILADPEFDLDIALYHGEFASCSAVMEHDGVPIDMEIYPILTDKKVWRFVRDAMVPEIDAKYGVYVRNAAGDWTFNMQKFEAYLEQHGLLASWPRLETGKLNMKDKVFENMSKGAKQLEELRQLRHSRNKMRKIKLAVGRDGRNRTVLWPFKAKTSRTQPKASEWIFSPAVWLRSLIKPGPGMSVAYVDYSSMEFLNAAGLSDGHCGPVNNMLDMYRSGDPYLAFAKSVKAVPETATKQSHEDLRDQYKVMMLAAQYGISAETLAGRLSSSVDGKPRTVSTLEAHEMLLKHREQFSQYWAWSDDWLQHSLQTGVMCTPLGWTCRTGITEFSELSIRNWPIQAIGGDILRIAIIWALRHGIKVVAPVHDAVLIEAPIDLIEAHVALMQEIMKRASRVVLGNDTAGVPIELRTDAKIIRYPDHYTDKRGDKIFAKVMGLLEQHLKQKAIEGDTNATRLGQEATG
jgi:DNA polymerase-1